MTMEEEQSDNLQNQTMLNELINIYKNVIWKSYDTTLKKQESAEVQELAANELTTIKETLLLSNFNKFNRDLEQSQLIKKDNKSIQNFLQDTLAEMRIIAIHNGLENAHKGDGDRSKFYSVIEHNEDIKNWVKYRRNILNDTEMELLRGKYNGLVKLSGNVEDIFMFRIVNQK
jgi:hypothetical protein